mmetsp:Transcript_30994/g.67725  ORF Transcript_30994/g.67725 Transcript_30994/m.67725 type:complete len:279 (+) Transcript_30994:355-1191(+)
MGSAAAARWHLLCAMGAEAKWHHPEVSGTLRRETRGPAIGRRRSTVIASPSSLRLGCPAARAPWRLPPHPLPGCRANVRPTPRRLGSACRAECQPTSERPAGASPGRSSQHPQTRRHPPGVSTRISAGSAARWPGLRHDLGAHGEVGTPQTCPCHCWPGLVPAPSRAAPHAKQPSPQAVSPAKPRSCLRRRCLASGCRRTGPSPPLEDAPAARAREATAEPQLQRRGSRPWAGWVPARAALPGREARECRAPRRAVLPPDPTSAPTRPPHAGRLWNPC